jgi:phospholipase C
MSRGLFATYQPPASGQTVFNLLSEGIVKTDGSPGPNFQQAPQQQAIDAPADEFMLSPRQTGSFTTLPQRSNEQWALQHNQFQLRLQSS